MKRIDRFFMKFCAKFMPLEARQSRRSTFPTVSTDSVVRAQTCEEAPTLAAYNTILKGNIETPIVHIYSHSSTIAGRCVLYILTALFKKPKSIEVSSNTPYTTTTMYQLTMYVVSVEYIRLFVCDKVVTRYLKAPS
jgi:predicted transcriptional regulator